MIDPSEIPPAGKTWRATVGLVDPDLPNWRRVRGAQYRELMRALPLTASTFMVAAVLIALLFATSIPAWQLGLWLTCSVALMLSALLLSRHAQPAMIQGPRPGALFRSGTHSALVGLLWSLPPALFAVGSTPEQQLAASVICCGLMALSAMTASPVPFVLICYLVPAALGLSIMMLEIGAITLAPLPIVYAILLSAGGVGAGRALIARHWTDHVLAEQTEVVRLLLREFEEAGADWLWQVDSAKRLSAVSARFARAAGRAPGELEGLPLLDLLSGDTASGDAADALRRLIDQMNGRERFNDLVFEVLVDGVPRWWSLSAAPRFTPDGSFDGYRGVGSDVTEQRRSAEKIDRLARFDALTGLPNRREFIDKLRTAVGQALGDRYHCALLLIDLDKFKPVNDTLGHPIGDRLLKMVADRLRGLIGHDDVCGRLGGDEFAVMLTRVGPGMIEAAGGAIIAALGTPFEIDGNIIRIGASIGSALAPRDGRSVETLVRNADLALYRAKDDGRGTLRRYDPSLLVQAERRRAMETALREAIDSGDQFRLVYQPVVAVDTGAIQSFETLIRWNHPTLGDVSPVDFLQIAEEARLAGRIGEWVLRTACLAARDWPDHIRLSVNLALSQLHDRQFAATVLSALSHAGIQPHRLELEVSETFFLKDDPLMVAVLDSVQALGVRVVLDDFGIGYTSLGHIRFGRYSAVKIDTSFVRGAADGNRESLAIVRAGVAMADALGVATVAEGAESEADVASMRGLGLNRIQGHFAGSPMTPEAAAALVCGDMPDAAASFRDARAG
ncbi:MAG TPA: EAL domain-containing protein [Sphingomonas sp.]|jgi:diguanylate cyclase (GGDEF)-like protein/PAS domain S-box-containing protein|uniref:putative bifunctional diguanylate cyclase/phosphodiesterase n=1 Tax=Sphingomonas sp. TaxID=28214 RepID=UPI002ED90678